MVQVTSLLATVFGISFLVYSVYWGTDTFRGLADKVKWPWSKLLSCYVCFGFWTAVASVIIHFLISAISTDLLYVINSLLIAYAFVQVLYRWHNPI